MISACSYQRDDILVKKSLNPNELRKKLYSIRPNTPPVVLSDIDDSEWSPIKTLVGKWAEDSTCTFRESIVIMRISSDCQDDDEFFSHSDVDEVYCCVWISDGILKVGFCSISIGIEDSRVYSISNPCTLKEYGNIFELLKTYDLLIEILVEKYGYVPLIKSL